MQTFRNTLNMVLVAMATLALGIMANTYDAPLGNFNGTPAQIAESHARMNENLNVPVWTAADARKYDACVSVDAPNHGNPFYAKIIVVRLNGDRDTLAFTKENVAYIKRVGDIWTIGKCR